MPYTLIDHTADIGIRVRARNIQNLYEEAGYAMVDILGASLQPGAEQIEMRIDGLDRIDLLVRWLQEILYFIGVKGFRVSDIQVTALTETNLSAVLTGGTAKTPLATEIKAVTYHDLTIREIDNQVETIIILDT